MGTDFVQIDCKNFVVNGEPIILRGWALGTWMILEHHMMGIPGTDSMMRI
ncbi:MAG: hypothetical protein GX213_07095 [Clostridiaceae bacterium]|nr:hypothetical protein [Clostridiaceae bacterium]